MSRYPFAYEYPGSLTALQWSQKGFLPKHGAKGSKCWTNRYCQQTAVYYCRDAVEEASPEALDEFRKPFRERRNERRRELRQRKREMLRQLEEERRRSKEKQRHYRYVMNLTPIPHDPVDVIVFNVATTGICADINEILQISIINGNGDVLLDSLVRPYFIEEWSDAESVNGITLDMVRNAPYAEELIPAIKGIFKAAGTIVAYNMDFNLDFLQSWGVCVDGKKQVDVMRDFAAIYGEWSEYYGDYKWQRLTTAARYYGYDFSTHDCLDDARAALYVYKKMSVSANDVIIKI